MCGGSDNTTTQTQTQSLPPWLQQNYQNLQSQAQGIAATPYQTYDQSRVAPLTQGQQQATDTAQAMQGNYEGDLNTARTYGNMAAGNVAGNYYAPTTFKNESIHVPLITPQQSQAQYAQTQYAPAAAQAGTQYAQAQQAQAQQAQTQYAQAQQAGYAQAQAPGAVQAQGIGAMQIGTGNVGTGQFGQQAFQQYGSPYQQDVINSTMAELNRQKTLDQGQATSQATLGGAFGGDRAAVQQAEIGRNYGQIQAQALAGLNNQNWAQAQNMFTNDQARGLQAQGMNQSAGLQASMANQGTNLQAQQANQSAALQAGLANQGWQGNVGLANMGAANTAQLQNAQLGTQANLQNANLGTNTSQFNAGLGTQNSQFNAGLGTQTSQFNAGQGNQVGMYNAGLTTQNNQFNAGQGNQVGMYNAGLGTQNSQFNAGLNYTGQAQNVSNSLQGQQFMASQNLQAQQLSDQSRQYNASLAAADRNRQLAVSQNFGNITGQEQQAKLNDIGALMQTGGMQQAQNQQNLDTAYNDFLAQRQYPFQTTSWLGGIYNGTPAPVSSTGTTVTPGPSPISQIAGAGLGAAALYGMYGGFKDGGMARRGLGAGYADGGPAQQQPLSFWGAGPNGISPALQIALGIMGGQSPHALTNIGQGAAQGLKAQQEAGMNAAKMKLWGAEGRKTSAEADVLEGDQQYDKNLNLLLSGKGDQIIPAGKRGAAMVSATPGAGVSDALPGAPAAAPASPPPADAVKGALAAAGPVPGTTGTAPVAPPDAGAPAPSAPVPGVGDVQTPVPQAAPAGGGMIPPAQPAPAAAVPQTPPAEATTPNLPAPRPSAQMAQAAGVTMQDVAAVNQQFPQLARDQKLLTALQDPRLGSRMSPRAMSMMEGAQKRIDKVAETGRAMTADGGFGIVPSWLTAKVQEDFATTQAKTAGEYSVKVPGDIKIAQGREQARVGPQMAIDAARIGREGAMQKNVAAFKVPLEAQYRPTQYTEYDPATKTSSEMTDTAFGLANRTRAGAGGGATAGGSPSPTMAGFGLGSPSSLPAGGEAPAPTPSPAAPVQAQAQQAGPGPIRGKQIYNPQQIKEMEGLGEDISKEYGALRSSYTTSKSAEHDLDMASQALSQAQSGKWALGKAETARILKAINIDPANFNLDDPKWMQIVTKAAVKTTFDNIDKVSSQPAFKEVQMAGQASFAPETEPGANKVLVAGYLSGISWKNKLFEAQEEWRQGGKPLSSFPMVQWQHENPMPAEYQRVLDSMPKFKGEDQGKPTASDQIKAPSNPYKQLSNEEFLKNNKWGIPLVGVGQ